MIGIDSSVRDLGLDTTSPHSTSFAEADPIGIGFVPMPVQLIAKLELPVKLMVSPMSCEQPLGEPLLPANATEACGK
jgi:hypothetical protein